MHLFKTDGELRTKYLNGQIFGVDGERHGHGHAGAAHPPAGNNRRDRQQVRAPRDPRPPGGGQSGANKRQRVSTVSAAKRVVSGGDANANRYCYSRTQKGSVCSFSPCRFTHECPCHPGEFHSADDCPNFSESVMKAACAKRGY